MLRHENFVFRIFVIWVYFLKKRLEVATIDKFQLDLKIMTGIKVIEC